MVNIAESPLNIECPLAPPLQIRPRPLRGAHIERPECQPERRSTPAHPVQSVPPTNQLPGADRTKPRQFFLKCSESSRRDEDGSISEWSWCTWLRCAWTLEVSQSSRLPTPWPTRPTWSRTWPSQARIRMKSPRRARRPATLSATVPACAGDDALTQKQALTVNRIWLDSTAMRQLFRSSPGEELAGEQRRTALPP